jgi:hypothetical protein
MIVTLERLEPSKREIARMACIRETDAVRCLRFGEYARAYDYLSAADALWNAALDCIGSDGAQWDGMKK